MKAADALMGLRVLGLPYRPDVRVRAGQWVAVCPRCVNFDGVKLGLVLRERYEGAPVSASCDQCEPSIVIATLAAALRPRTLEQRVRALELEVLALRAGGAS